MAKTPSHPFSIKVLMSILGIVAIPVLALVAIQPTDNRSKASFDGLQQCLSRCKTGEIGNNFFGNRSSKCKLDCQQVVNKTMSCGQFCQRNFMDRREGLSPNDGKGKGTSCMSQCQTWSDTTPCKGADGSSCTIGTCPTGVNCNLKTGTCTNHVCIPHELSTQQACAGEGSPCFIEKCIGYECEGVNCPAMPKTCPKQTGTCRNSVCEVSRTLPTNGSNGPAVAPACRLPDSEKTVETWGQYSADKSRRMRTICTTKVVNCSGTTSCRTEQVVLPTPFQ